MSCLRADEVTRLFAQGLSHDERRAVDAHVDDCAACRHWLVAVARDHRAPDSPCATTADGAPTADPDRSRAPADHHVVLRAGDHVARYRIERFLGAGAMGAVYEARDPELDRRVALKLVPIAPDEPAEGRAARLVREAQAMARLAHPNIVPVYDAGRSGAVAFIAMQRVDGMSLREHLATVRSSAAARLALVCAAGRGLAMAHDAGIVHRDLKPDNILIDRNGTALVGDFGLARLPDEREAPGSGTDPIDAADWRTAHGTILGTPRYMPPEVARGARGDARADQFSFAVTLAEALGAAPGDDRARQALPRRIRRVVARALSSDPQQRFPSMTALLDALEPRVTLARGAIAIGVITVAVAALWPRAASVDPVDACRRAAEERLHGAWDPAARRTLETQLGGLQVPGGSAAIRSATIDRIERYTHDWLAMRREVCEATGVHGEQTATLRDLRMTCLDDRLVELAAMRRAIAGLAAPELVAAPGLGALLGDLAQCGDARSLARRAPGDPAALATSIALKRELVEANATILRGRLTELSGGVATGYAAAEQATTRVSATAHAARLPAIEADALRIRASLLRRGDGIGDPSGYYESLAIGDRLADPGLRVDALIGLLGGAVGDPARAGEIALLTRLSETALAELPGAQHERRARLAGNLAEFHRDRGELAVAEQHGRAAVQHLDAARGPGDPYSLNARQILASVLFARRDLAGARQVRAEMRAAVGAVFGARSPYGALVLVDEGRQLAGAGLTAEARAVFEQALALAEALYGTQHALVARIAARLQALR